MELFFSDAAAQIDWSKGYENLDKEFQQIVRDAEIGKRLADKLVKVWLIGGQERVVYVHTEIQGSPDKEFEQRMYTYHYRIFDRYNGHVVSLAVLADEANAWHPRRFKTDLWGCRLQFEFPVVKLNQYRNVEYWKQLEASNNPFARVIMAHLKTQDTRKDNQDRKQWKMALTKSLYTGGFTTQQILDIYWFMDWVMYLPTEIAEQFDVELQEFEKEKKMTYVTTMERRGIDKGMQQGMQQGEQKTLLRILRKRFGEVTPAIEKMVADAPVEQIEVWIDAALDADALQQVFPDV
ncbi:MAG: DUF4351 domain-containing protein [Spartobacteria bacterium]|nr:DUF4351 domain-containing protein [Spartobacteria bacterium]